MIDTTTRVTEYRVMFFSGEWSDCTSTAYRDKADAQAYIDSGVAVGHRREHYRIEHRTVTFSPWASTYAATASGLGR